MKKKIVSWDENDFKHLQTYFHDIVLFISQNYSISVSNIWREAFHYHYLQTPNVYCKSMDILKSTQNLGPGSV